MIWLCVAVLCYERVALNFTSSIVEEARPFMPQAKISIVLPSFRQRFLGSATLAFRRAIDSEDVSTVNPGGASE